MAGVFVSYRRQAGSESVDRLLAALTRALGRGQVQSDVEALRADDDDSAAIAVALNAATVGLILIDPAFLADPDELMLAEIEAALAHRLPLLVVLLQGAPRPRPAELPAALAALAHLPALPLRDAQRARDQRLVIETLVSQGGLVRRESGAGKARLATPARFHWLVAGAAVAIALLVGLGFWAGQPGADRAAVTARAPH